MNTIYKIMRWSKSKFGSTNPTMSPVNKAVFAYLKKK
jgi:hypothetical protein